MSLINQMLQDLDAQQGSEQQPVVPEIAPVAVKGRFSRLPGFLGMLLAALLGAGVTWVLGQPKSESLEGGLIPLALPDLLATGKRTENHRAPGVASRVATADPPKPKASGEIPFGSKSKDPNPTGRAVVAPAETLVKRQVQLREEQSIMRLVKATEEKPAPPETQARLTDANPSPEQQISVALSFGGEQESVERQLKKPQSVKSAARLHRTGGEEEVAPDSFRDARLYLRQGRLADAEEALRRSLEANPGMSKAREILAALLLRGERRSEAATLLDQGLQLAPEQSVFLSLRSRLYREQGNTDKAIALLQQGWRDDRDNGDLLALLGVLYQEEGRFSEAAAVYRRILKQRPGSANSWAGLAISLDAAGERATALQAYRRALVTNQLAKEVAEYAQQRVSVLESQ